MATKLKDLLIEMFEDETPKINKYEVIESVAEYSNIGKQLYSTSNIMEIAEGLVKMAESAHNHILSETDDWFDKVSINRNMKSLQKMVSEFKKTSTEHNSTGQRLVALYEDIGSILNRYYEIKEAHEDGEHEPMKGDKDEYQQFFMGALKKFGVSEPDQLPDDKKKEFYNYVDANWSGDKESDSD
ncbi:hypothetical protein CMI37_00215 [Candidatus Pacearchaeota archaeon]|nr:hypothetical protein [Candidatus Pacearchaeota archaeon]|tara:strand:+ start:1147 stop:1701 length:555 start_codon:yes stop_codon:yes gene_type:complete